MGTNTELVLSLEDLLQIALGTESLTGVNTIVLHSLLDLVLKKLGCENETISISGYDAMVIEKLLKESSISPLAFDSIEMKTIQQFDCLNQLERTIDELEEKVDRHLEEVRNDESIKTSNNSFANLPIFSKDLICSTCESAKQEMCNLIADPKFTHKLLEETILPVYQHFQAMSKKLDDFETEFVKWLVFMEQYLVNIGATDTVMKRILDVDDDLIKYRNDFMSAMENLQDILDTKVDRCDVISLQNAVDQRIDEIRSTINEYVTNVMKRKTTIFALESHSSDSKKHTKSRNAIEIGPACDCQTFIEHNSRPKKAHETQNELDSQKPKLNVTSKRSYSDVQ